MRGILLIVASLALLVGIAAGMLFPRTVGAQASPPNVTLSLPAAGSDMWTGAMGRLGFFVPHFDNCDPVTEAFVSMLPNGMGYCIEKDERAAQTWISARNICLQDRKRLPEPAEWLFACEDRAPLGLNDMHGNSEGTSNAFVGMRDGGNVGNLALGEGDCDTGRIGVIVDTDQASMAQTNSFRCVR